MRTKTILPIGLSMLLNTVAGCNGVCVGGECYEDANGWNWCVEAIGANGTRTANGFDVQIKENGDWVGGCVRMCAGDNDIMTLGADGEIVAGHPLESIWNDLKTNVRDSAEGNCEARVTELAVAGAINFNGMVDITCGEAVAILEPVEGDATFTDECAAAGTGGDASEVGPGQYGLTSYNQVRSCTTNTGAKTITCSVDSDFIAYVASDIWTIFADEAKFVTVSGPSGLKFSSCASTSLLYALGFRVNDRLVSVDGHPTVTMEDGNELFSLLGQTFYTGTPATAKFYRSGVLWTMTVNRTNLTSYP